MIVPVDAQIRNHNPELSRVTLRNPVLGRAVFWRVQYLDANASVGARGCAWVHMVDARML